MTKHYINPMKTGVSDQKINCVKKTYWIPRDIFRELDSRSKRTGRTMSRIVVDALKKWMEKPELERMKEEEIRHRTSDCPLPNSAVAAGVAAAKSSAGIPATGQPNEETSTRARRAGRGKGPSR